MKEHWKDEPDEHDYPAAFDYLTLVASEETVAKLVDQLKKADLTHRKALSPVLLVRGHGHPGFATADDLVIADGYHRVCASYHLDENADIPCKLM
ncbi:hypothetical protein [Amycolatopsis silviterrae]|uniref:ParB/Sulfiredoxin domain-containing protein n=1 Tax=Amycolatopsis silviterrae TaxID=1656914 RepID=A0ABW5HN99_9PSEU